MPGPLPEWRGSFSFQGIPEATRHILDPKTQHYLCEEMQKVPQ